MQAMTGRRNIRIDAQGKKNPRPWRVEDFVFNA